MRIDGYSSAYERPGRSSGALVPYREGQRTTYVPQPESTRASAPEAEPVEGEVRRVEPGSAIFELRQAYASARFSDAGDARPLSSRAAQALASYTTTARYNQDFDSSEVVGLDLYA